MSYKYFPKRLPYAIIGVLLVYTLTAVGLGYAFYGGANSPKVLNLARFFPIPIAKVDGQFIWARQFIEYKNFMENFIARSSAAGDAVDLDINLDRQVAEILIQNFLIEQVAKEFNLRTTRQEIDESYRNLLILENGEGPAEEISEEELQTVLEELYGSNSDRLKDFIRITLLEGKIKSEIIEQVKFRHILVATAGQASDLIERVDQGDDFADLAAEFSRDELTRDEGGEVNFVSRSDVEGAGDLQQALFSNDMGLVLEPVQSPNGFHVIEILEKKGRVAGTFSDFLDSKRKELGVKVFIQINESAEEGDE